ncbi:MAG TPA: hypothetical protein VHC90_08990 [Bryobacteraceae bacterium]|nr:hypothetical protein [Bryobacteraceae bacterium]
MRIILFGASGMVGQGVLRECLRDPDVDLVLLIGRTPIAQQHPKIRQIVRPDPGDLAPIQSELTGYDATFFCLGVSSAGMSAADYKRLTYDLTIRAARTLADQNPQMTFIYVSGKGTDSSERGAIAWARVKGATENALLRMPFKAAYMFRPGAIRPMHGEQPKASATRIALKFMGWTIPIIQTIAPNSVTTTERIGRAMINAAKHGATKKVLESADINALSSTVS